MMILDDIAVPRGMGCVAFLLVLLSACDKSEYDTDVNSLQGRWLNCVSPASKTGVELVFHGASWAVYSGAYADLNCENRINVELVEQGEFLIGDEFVIDNDVTTREIDVTTRFGNIDVYKEYFDIIYVEQDRLFFGKNETGSLASRSRRPTKIDYKYSFNRI